VASTSEAQAWLEWFSSWAFYTVVIGLTLYFGFDWREIRDDVLPASIGMAFVVNGVMAWLEKINKNIVAGLTAIAKKRS
jgi:hypothetical protein